jgi:hypothetical protein
MTGWSESTSARIAPASLPTDLAWQQQVGRLPQREAHALGESQAAAQHLHRHAVEQVRQLARFLDHNHPLLFADGLQQPAGEGGLAAAGTAGDQHGHAVP